MILKELVINNFRSYYKENRFTFNEGLTLIIGGNGDGKTTFFDSLEWLFSTYITEDYEDVISEKRKFDMLEGDVDTTTVTLVFEHNGTKILEKRIEFEKKSDNKIIILDTYFEGWIQNENGREKISGEDMLELCSFDSAIRKYCMFKGESDLNVFDNETALKTLVNTFTDIGQFDRYLDLLNHCDEQSGRAHRRELRNDNRIAQEVDQLENQLDDVVKSINRLKGDISLQEQNRQIYGRKIEEIEHNQDISEKYQRLKTRISTLKDNYHRTRAAINEEYNVNLLDDYWILTAFPAIFQEFKSKVSSLGKMKRTMETQDIEKKAKEAGKKEAIQDLANGIVPLPWYLPDDETMKEMIDEKICKVCNREAKEDSEAYKFMTEKLEMYIKNTEAIAEIEANKEKEKSLFPNYFIEEMQNISISFGGNNLKDIVKLKSDIKERVLFNSNLSDKARVIEDNIKQEEYEVETLLIHSNINGESLENIFSNLTGYFEYRGKAERALVSLEMQLNRLIEEEKKIQERFRELNPESNTARVYSLAHSAFVQILNAFEKSKKKTLELFLKSLQERSNDYLRLLNDDGFHGSIELKVTENETTHIRLVSNIVDEVTGIETKTEIVKPNGALQTTMYMSVLFAISDLTTVKKEQDYPLIFDAPTSSFEMYREDLFYNLRSNLNKQCVIVTKDLLIWNKESNKNILDYSSIESLDCTVYRIEKQRPFDPNDLSTVCTTSKLIQK